MSLLAFNMCKGSLLCCKCMLPVLQTPSLNFNPSQYFEHKMKGLQDLWIAVKLGCQRLPVSLFLETLKLVRLGSSEGSSAGREPEATFCFVQFLQLSYWTVTKPMTRYRKVRPAGELFKRATRQRMCCR